MKIIVLHGDDERKLHERFLKFIESAKSRSWEVVYLDDTPSIKEALSGSSLFGNERFFVLRDIKKLGKPEIDWLKKKAESLPGNLVIYSEGYVPVAITKGITSNIRIEEFKLPKLVFSFLEMIRPGNSTQIIKTLHELVEKEPIEFIFALIAKHLRDLYWSKVDAGSMPYPPWRTSKLQGQAEKFETDQLKDLISRFSEIDIEVKTSSADLLSSLDLVVIKQLK